MPRIVAKIYSCNVLTYSEIYLDAVKRAYLEDGIEISDDEICLEIIDLSENNTRGIQSQKAANGPHSRTITVYQDSLVKYVIGVSNTNYDKDIIAERTITGRRMPNNNNYHGNTFIFQGINKIFNRFFEAKNTNSNVKLFFYVLDVETSVPHNKFNLFSYRILSTLGFNVLNIDEIRFDNLSELGFRISDTHNIAYLSFNKLMNDQLIISNSNSSNMPSYLRCEEMFVQNDNGNQLTEVYIYMFKVLSAQMYHSAVIMCALNLLAKRENKILKFELSPELYGFLDRNNSIATSETTGFTAPVNEFLSIMDDSIEYVTVTERRQIFNREKEQYERAKEQNTIRNQSLFKNNLRRKGIPTKCVLCGCEEERILEAAHLWEINQISNANSGHINSVMRKEHMMGLLRNNTVPIDLFYKRYVLANSGDNGVWLCSNHHGIFDRDIICFGSDFGEVIFNREESLEQRQHILSNITNIKLDESIMTPCTKEFIYQRMDSLRREGIYFEI